MINSPPIEHPAVGGDDDSLGRAHQIRGPRLHHTRNDWQSVAHRLEIFVQLKREYKWWENRYLETNK